MMIQEAVLQLSILRQDGAVLIVYKKDVKVPELFAIKGGLDLTSMGEELDGQNFAVDGQDISLSNAELPQEKTQEKEMTDAATQSEKTSESDEAPPKPEMVDKDSQVDINVCAGDTVHVDVGIQTDIDVKMENTEMQTEKIPESETSEKVDTSTEKVSSYAQTSAAQMCGVSVEVQTDNAEVKNKTLADSENSEQDGECRKPATDDVCTQTDPLEGPLLNDLLARIAELQARKAADMIKAEPGTSDGTPHRKGLRKRLFQQQLLSSTEVSDDENYDVDGDGSEYESDKSFVRVTKQWNKDLETVISSLQHDENGPDKMGTRASKPIKTSAPQKLSKRKRGRPRKVPQEIKPESSGDEDDSPVKEPGEIVIVPKKKKVPTATLR